MSTKASRVNKSRQNYNPHPPSCRTCKYFCRATRAKPPVIVDGVTVSPGVSFAPHTCTFPLRMGGRPPFAVLPTALCDEWEPTP